MPPLNLFSHSDWLARPLSLQMFTDWIMELSLLLLIQSITFPTLNPFMKHATTLVITCRDGGCMFSSLPDAFSVGI